QTASEPRQAIAALERQAADVVLLDLRLGKHNGFDLLVRLLEGFPRAAVIVMTAYGSIQSSVECMKAGAYYYVTKPLDMVQVRHILHKACDYVEMKRRVEYLESELCDRYAPQGIIGRSKEMQKVFELISKVKDIDANVLVTGESGTGKEMVARALHYGGRRSRRRFEVVNCAAIPGTLLESQLFGHEKGAFTGASARKPGSFEVADGGTVFLDEIGEMDGAIQSKLLRVIQNREFTPLGATRARKVDVRIVAATNKDLEREVQERRFRNDLYYRLNVINIHVPPLRERVEDIPPLVAHFVSKYSQRFAKPVRGVDPAVVALLERHAFPGNVRELENVIERAVALCEGELLSLQDLPDGLRVTAGASADSVSYPERLADLERAAILASLERHGGNRREVARSLGISERSLRNKLRQYRSEQGTNSA
ncbi:MAG: sigma-54-dependent transcriptional regulator, partial [Bacillota bacterium]